MIHTYCEVIAGKGLSQVSHENTLVNAGTGITPQKGECPPSTTATTERVGNCQGVKNFQMEVNASRAGAAKTMGNWRPLNSDQKGRNHHQKQPICRSITQHKISHIASPSMPLPAMSDARAMGAFSKGTFSQVTAGKDLSQISHEKGLVNSGAGITPQKGECPSSTTATTQRVGNCQVKNFQTEVNASRAGAAKTTGNGTDLNSDQKGPNRHQKKPICRSITQRTQKIENIASPRTPLPTMQEASKISKFRTDRSDFDHFVTYALRPNPNDIHRGYSGRINPNYKWAQYVYIRDVANNILFSQTSVSDSCFERGRIFPLDDLVNSLFIRFGRFGALDIVKITEENYVSLDNRRLLISKKIAVIDRYYGIWIRVHQPDEELDLNNRRRFRVSTWGEALKERVEKSYLIGYSNYPTIVCEKRIKASSQSLLLMISCDLRELHPEDVKNIKSRNMYI